MLAFFPYIYEDEDIRSVIYRYHKMSGNRRFAQSIAELFGCKSDKNPPIPENVMFLQNQLPDNVDNLLENHTLINYIAPFSSINLSNSRHAVFTGKKLLSEKIRYCAICLENEFVSFGECYVHKTHQIEFIKLCPKHREVLIATCPVCNVYLTSTEGNKLLDAPNCPNGHTIGKTMGQTISRFEEKMYQAFDEFKHYSAGLTRPIFLSRVETWLGEKGYYSFTGSVLLRRKLIKDIIDHFGQLELDKLGQTSSYLHSSSTMQKMINSKEKGTANVIFFFLLMIFLAGSVQAFFEKQPIYALPIPFGNGPWECLNKLCPYYKQKVIRDSVRSNDRGLRIVGEFRCNYCSSSYKRSWYWPVREEQDVRPMVSKGKDFYEALIMLKEQGSTIRSIAKQLKTAHSTIKIFLDKYETSKSRSEMEVDFAQLEEINASFAQASCAREIIDRSLECREKMKSILLEMDDPKRSLLRKKDPTTYDWLLKNDRAWMEKSMPASKKNVQKVDWDKEDIEICHRITEMARRIYMSPPPHRRITPSVISNELPAIDRNRLRRAPHKLPKAISKLKQYYEDPESFQIRYLLIALNKLSNCGLPLSVRTLKNRFPTIYREMSFKQQELISGLVLDYKQ